MTFNCLPKLRIAREPGTEPIPLNFRVGDVAVAMIWTVFLLTEGIAFAVLFDKQFACDSREGMAR